MDPHTQTGFCCRVALILVLNPTKDVSSRPIISNWTHLFLTQRNSVIEVFYVWNHTLEAKAMDQYPEYQRSHGNRQSEFRRVPTLDDKRPEVLPAGSESAVICFTLPYHIYSFRDFESGILICLQYFNIDWKMLGLNLIYTRLRVFLLYYKTKIVYQISSYLTDSS